MIWIIIVCIAVVALGFIWIYFQYSFKLRWIAVIALFIIGLAGLLTSSEKAISIFHLLGLYNARNEILFDQDGESLGIKINTGILRRGVYAVCIESDSGVDIDKMLRLNPVHIRQYKNGVLIDSLFVGKPIAKIFPKSDRLGYSIIYTFLSGGLFEETKTISIELKNAENVTMKIKPSPVP